MNMKRLYLLAASAAAAVICAAIPISLDWSSANVPLLSSDQANARAARPVARARVVGASRRVQRRTTAAATAAVIDDEYDEGPAPAPYYAPGPAVVAPAPPVTYVEPMYGYGEPVVVDNPVTGRWCRIESNGYRFCWTP
jgi:hypothetical protein